jgi:vacuolar-type H+-ATPase subunit F/Vma7
MLLLRAHHGKRGRAETVLRTGILGVQRKIGLGRIALIADRQTSTYFKVSGIKNSFAVKDNDEAEKAFRKLHSDETISLIMVTEPVYEWIRPIVERTKKEFPLVVSIPAKSGPKAQADALAQLIKKTVGIELKVK